MTPTSTSILRKESEPDLYQVLDECGNVPSGAFVFGTSSLVVVVGEREKWTRSPKVREIVKNSAG